MGRALALLIATLAALLVLNMGAADNRVIMAKADMLLIPLEGKVEIINGTVYTRDFGPLTVYYMKKGAVVNVTGRALALPAYNMA
ncbi:MAG: hypothetical protein ACP5H5_03720 [Pyrobaculum sp.]